MRKFCIITNPYKDRDFSLTNRMKSYIQLKGGSCHKIAEGEDLPQDAEGIFVLGGDGTLIRTAGIASEKGIPLIGVNLGHLGYLCELEEKNVYAAIDEIMKGNYMIEERMMLSGSSDTRRQDAQFPKKSLNDIVILRKGALQLMELLVSVNGGYLHTFRADGIIVATPTGSTGYSLSAGGPIIDPRARMILITPINAHDLNSKSIIVEAEDEITIELKCRQPEKQERADVNLDGELAMELSPGDSITIRAAEQTAKIIKLSKISFLEILRKRMQIYT